MSLLYTDFKAKALVMQQKHCKLQGFLFLRLRNLEDVKNMNALQSQQLREARKKCLSFWLPHNDNDSDSMPLPVLSICIYFLFLKKQTVRVLFLMAYDESIGHVLLLL